MVIECDGAKKAPGMKKERNREVSHLVCHLPQVPVNRKERSTGLVSCQTVYSSAICTKEWGNPVAGIADRVAPTESLG